MSPYQGIISTLLSIQWTMAMLVIVLTGTMRRQLHLGLTFEPSLQLNRMHRERFPKSPLRWVRTSCLAICLPLTVTLLVFIHMNSVQNHLYFANQQKQIQQNAQLIQAMKAKGR